jgi:hypothetical protein
MSTPERTAPIRRVLVKSPEASPGAGKAFWKTVSPTPATTAKKAAFSGCTATNTIGFGATAAREE